MENLEYITENRVRELVEQESSKAREEGKQFIREPKNFSTHLIDTGNNGYKISCQILSMRPSLTPYIDPNVVRTEGYFHGFGKITVGDAYHEIEGAYLILTRGEEWGLVSGGHQKKEEKN